MIAGFLGGEIVGDKNAAVHTVSSIEEGRAGSLAYLTNPKYEPWLYKTEASIVLVDKTFEPSQPVAATLIKVENAGACVVKLLEMYNAAKPRRTGISELASVAPDAKIGVDCYIGDFAVVEAGAVIGDGCQIYPQVYVGTGVTVGEGTILYPGVKIYYNCRIGRRCVLHSGAVIGADGFGFAPDAAGVYHKIPQLGIVEIDDDVEIGANTTVDRSTMGRTHIGRGTKLDNLIMVAHNCEIGHDTVMASQSGIAGSTKLGSNCMVGGQVGFAGHITVGDRVQIGAQSGISKSVEDGARIMGSPAIPMGEWARMIAAQKHLVELTRRMSQLEKELAKKQ